MPTPVKTTIKLDLDKKIEDEATPRRDFSIPAPASARFPSSVAYLPVILASVVQVVLLALVLAQFWSLVRFESAANHLQANEIKAATDELKAAMKLLGEREAEVKKIAEAVANAERSARASETSRTTAVDKLKALESATESEKTALDELTTHMRELSKPSVVAPTSPALIPTPPAPAPTPASIPPNNPKPNPNPGPSSTPRTSRRI